MVYNDVVIYFLIDVLNNPHHLARIVYHFPPGIIPKAQRHGNAKRDEPFYPSWVRSKELIKLECQASRSYTNSSSCV